jgi:RNA polymerase sigma-70 factor (ECF subfamily)
MTRPDDAIWVLRAQCGDREALERLLLNVQPALRRYVATLVGPADADDLVQEALLQIYRKLAWLRDAELFRPWAFRIASRVAFRHLKAKRRLPQEVGDQALDTMPAVADPPTATELSAIPAIAGVSPASRAVLNLHFEHDLTLAEVAVVLDIPLGTVRSRLAYGLAVLRKLLKEERST